jgi:hypothetical protein
LQPTRLLSPETVLKRRKGNSFEMATLLCSVLVGFGFPALVVSGYATREVTLDNQSRVVCPYTMEELDVSFPILLDSIVNLYLNF